MIMTFTDDHASKSTHTLGNNVYHRPDPFTTLFGQLIAIVTTDDSFLYLCLWRCSWNPVIFVDLADKIVLYTKCWIKWDFFTMTLMFPHG